MTRFTIPFEQIELQDIAQVGGKNASLGELTRELTSQGVAVPRGFALTAEALGIILFAARQLPAAQIR